MAALLAPAPPAARAPQRGSHQSQLASCQSKPASSEHQQLCFVRAAVDPASGCPVRGASERTAGIPRSLSLGSSFTPRLCGNVAEAPPGPLGRSNSWPPGRGQEHKFRDAEGPSTARGGAALTSARLFGPSIFEAQKLSVMFMGEAESKQHPKHAPQPRMYTLTHSDATAKLTLAVAHYFNHNQFMDWYSRLLRDEVLALWKHHCKGRVEGILTNPTTGQAVTLGQAATTGQDASTGRILEVSCSCASESPLGCGGNAKPPCHTALHVHCHVSGGSSFLSCLPVAALRFWVFRKELPVVLEAFRHGDRALFEAHPDLEEAPVWVHFHSNFSEYNKHECWGSLKNAPQVGKELAQQTLSFPDVAAREHRWPFAWAQKNKE